MPLLQLNTMFRKPPEWRFGREYGQVTKKEIVKQISDDLGLTQLKVKDIVQKTFDAIMATLFEEGRIELRNFGVFEVKRRKARKARNPRTGERVDVPPKSVVTFKPGKEMEERVRKMTHVPVITDDEDGDLAESNGASDGAAKPGKPGKRGKAGESGRTARSRKPAPVAGAE